MSRRRRATALTLALALAAGGCSPELARPAYPVLPDLSGLAWVEGDAFLAVHDAKVVGEEALPRVSLVTAPGPGSPARWTTLDVDWSAAGTVSHDLESVARVPGTATYLLAESGAGGSAYRRLYVAELAGAALTIREVADWPVAVFNVEGTAVARVGGALYFLFAERAHGEPSTRLVWARLEFDPLTLSDPHEAVLTVPSPTGPGARPVSALDVDADGHIYVASAYDPDRDEGPFQSAVWRVGRLVESDGGAELLLSEPPERVATLDGLKVEAVAVRPDGSDGVALFVGTDDEGYGGVLRRLP